MTLPDEALEAAAKWLWVAGITWPGGVRVKPFSLRGLGDDVLVALGGRVVVEKLCEHGRDHPHPLPIDESGGVPVSPDEWTGQCLGMERTVIWEDTQ